MKCPAQRANLCSLAQPVLRRAQRTPAFFFQDATLLLIVSGSLELHSQTGPQANHAAGAALLVDAGTRCNLLKRPSAHGEPFRSLLLTLASPLLELFDATAGIELRTRQSSAVRTLQLPAALQSTLSQVCASVMSHEVSDLRLRYRLLDLLAGLAECGHGFAKPMRIGTAARIRALIAQAPDFRWTAREAGRQLAMSEATLRRRLSQEQARFEELLVDVRMHHALMLLQTTDWSIAQIGEASGYLSRTRFAERFRLRFGYLPSAVR
jgi:AraC-like DNA-binding protein